MEDALKSLESNKGDSTEIFRQILHNSETRYDAVRLSINPIAMATYKRQVMSKPPHISKYVRLIAIISEQKAHLEHMSCEEWSVLVQFLIVAYSHIRESLKGLDFTRATSDLFRSLGLLLSTKECCNDELFAGVLSSCEDFIDLVGQKETVCHPHIMRCVRKLIELEYHRARGLGEKILALGRVRNSALIYELFVFACLCPQPLTDLLDLQPRIISSHEIEFLPSSQFGSIWFRPSGEADITKFIAARALSVSKDEDYSSNETISHDDVPPPKRFKPNSIESSNGYGNNGLNFMVKAFRVGPQDEFKYTLDYLRNENSSSGSGSRCSSVASGPSGPGSISGSTKASSVTEDDATKFWAFVLLSQSVPYMNREEQLLLWNLCIEHIQQQASSSGACFCLSQLVNELTGPAGINSNAVGKVRTLLNTMGSSSYPILSSGSLILYSKLYNVKILDDTFQKFKTSQLSQWLQSRIRDGTPRLINQHIAGDCPPAYLQVDEYEDLIMTGSISRIQKIQKAVMENSSHENYESYQACKSGEESLLKTLLGSNESSYLSRVYSPSIYALPQIQCKTLKESLWVLAILAKTNNRVGPVSQQRTDAFTVEDLAAIVWFSNLANYLQWDEDYCNHALNLALWTIPAKQYRSVSVAVSLLQRPGPAVSSAISGYTSPSMNFGDTPGTELRTVEPFLQSYNFQRSSWFLVNLTSLISRDAFKESREGRQLGRFLLNVGLKQSKFAPIRKALGSSNSISDKEMLEVLKTSSTISLLELISGCPSDLVVNLIISPEMAWEVVNVFSGPSKITAALILHCKRVLSLAQVIILLANEEVSEYRLEQISKLLGLSGGINYVASIVAVPLHFSPNLGSNDYQSILVKIGAPRALIQRFEHFMGQIKMIDTDRSDEYLAALTEQVIKECSYCGSDLEKSESIRAMATFIQAHRSHISDRLLSSFLKVALTSICSFEVGETKTSLAVSIVESYLKNRKDPSLLCTAAVFLGKSGFNELAYRVLSWLPKSPSHPPADLMKSIKNLKVRELPQLVISLLATSMDISYECWNMFLLHAIKAVEISGVTTSFEECSKLPDSAIRALISWTNYVNLPYSTPWLALIARLVASRGIFETEVHMCDTIYAPSTPQISHKNGKESVKETLMNVYNHLPYEKKWKIHPILQRLQVTEVSIPEPIMVGEDIFGEDSWLQEIEFRPYHIVENTNNIGLSFEPIGKIAECALGYLELPQLGLHTFQEVPELAIDFLPSLVSGCYTSISSVSSRSASSASIPKNLARLEFKETLEDNVTKCLKSGDTKEIGLNIIRKCYQRCQKMIVTPAEIALACKTCSDSKSSFKYVELGILVIELMWNEDPNKPIPKDILDCLRQFYANMHDEAFKFALPVEQNKPLGLLEGIRMNSKVSAWQQLEYDMVSSEANDQTFRSFGEDASILNRSFQQTGLWNLANRLDMNTNYYDFERIWWLREWDTVHIYKPEQAVMLDSASDMRKSLFQNPEYGALIGFFTEDLTQEETFAEIARTNIGMTSVFANILSNKLGSHKISLDTNSEKEIAVARYGREILFRQSGDTPALASELKSSCEYYRSSGNINRSLEFALKLEQLSILDASENQGARSSIQALSCIETAKTEWELGRQSAAISTLKGLLLECGDDNTNHDFDVADVYSTLGTWSRTARNEPDSSILESYFMKAEKMTTEHNVERVHHLYARFCDEACHDQSLITSIQDSERVKENEKRQVDYLSKAIQNGNTDKTFQNKYRISLRMLKAETEDYEGLKRRKFDLTFRCIQSYLLSMESGDSYEEDMGRFIALWLELWENKDINTLILEHVGEPIGGSSKLKTIARLPRRKFLPWMNQLSSRLAKEEPDNRFQKALQGIILGAVLEHPYHSIWYLINILRTKSGLDRASSERRNATKSIVHQASERMPSLVLNMIEFADKIVQLGSEKPPSDSKKVEIRTFGSSLAQWWNHKLLKMKLPVPTATVPVRPDCDYSEVPYIGYFKPEVDIAGGISAPKIVMLMDSEGKTHKMVLKGSEKDDLRQDAIMQQVFDTVSQVLSHQQPGGKRRRQQLRVRTYNVVPLGGVSGAIEFVKNTKSLQEILEPLHTLYGGRSEYSLRKARHAMHVKRDYNAAIRVATFEEVMKHTRPQMRHYWTKRFSDPHEWLEAKTSWCRSTAVSSILGYIVGLGDRHCSNLLVDTTTGEVVHIDLGIAFDQGKQLYIPETVPFRLTRDMVDGMGISGTAGVFTSAAESTLQVMRGQRHRIMTMLEVLKYDALYTWRLPPVRLNRIQFGPENQSDGVVAEAPRVETGQAEHALRGVRQKLSANLSCEAMVRDLVAQARDKNNLAMIFSGWSPFY